MSNTKESTTLKTGVSRREILAIAIIIGGAFIAILNQTVLSPALPKLMDAFQITAGTAQWVTTIYMLVNGIMVPVTAFLIDRFSTRKLFITSMVVFIAGTALAAFNCRWSVMCLCYCSLGKSGAWLWVCRAL